MSVSSIFNSDDEVVTGITKSISHARKCAKEYEEAVENMQSKKKQLAQTFSSSGGSIQYDNHEEDGARDDNQSFRLWEDQSDLRNYYVSGNSNTTNNTANTSLLSSR